MATLSWLIKDVTDPGDVADPTIAKLFCRSNNSYSVSSIYMVGVLLNIERVVI